MQSLRCGVNPMLPCQFWLSIYNNRIHDNFVCEGLQVGNPNEIDYVWNNIWYNNTSVGANGPQVPQSETPDSFYFWNNTVVGWTSCVQSAGHGFSWTGTFAAQNNYCINSNGASVAGSPSAGTVTVGNNIGVTPATATSQGFTSAETYVYSPASSNCNGIASNCPIGAGVNLSSMATGQLTALQQDTTYACEQGTVNGVVQAVCNQRTANTRPASGGGAWMWAPMNTAAPAPRRRSPIRQQGFRRLFSNCPSDLFRKMLQAA